MTVHPLKDDAVYWISGGGGNSGVIKFSSQWLYFILREVADRLLKQFLFFCQVEIQLASFA